MKNLLTLDAQLSQRLRLAEKPGPLRNTAIILAHSGDSWFWLLALAGVWLAGNAEWKRLALILGLGIVMTAGIVLAVKFTVRRQRPAGEWGAIYRSTDPHSFPSGHAARAILLGILTLIVGPTWLGLALLVWGPLVALARVAMGVHYVSDIAAGALLGGLLGWALGAWLPLMVK
jgi:undecaprenyl-diphosphatase